MNINAFEIPLTKNPVISMNVIVASTIGSAVIAGFLIKLFGG